MDLSRLLTKRNIEILDILSKEELSLRDLALKLKCSPAKVHQAMNLFNKANLINTRKEKNRIIIIPNKENILYQKIKSLINFNRIINTRALLPIKKLGLIGIYGSYAKGTNDKNSDIDLIILSDRSKLDIQESIRKLEKEIGIKINPLILTKQKLNDLEKKDKEFYIRLKLTTIGLNGDLFG